MNALPVVFGMVALIALAALLVVRDPSPGALSEGHASIGERLENCATCHTPTGLDAGCLACHDEIASQIRADRGYHADASRASDCARCHPDHHGGRFEMVDAIAWRPEGRSAFRHKHVEFALRESHDDLACAACHRAANTFLGLEQKCISCHADVHGSDALMDCTRCHSQTHFTPASGFRHDEFFALEGEHRTAKCAGCHLETDGAEFGEVQGQSCKDCHASPHRFQPSDDCATCHRADDSGWDLAAPRFDANQHRATGFVLSAKHEVVACKDCHQPGPEYAARFELPARKREDCASCHEDVHGGQFESACASCHEEAHFTPSRFTRERHTTFALRDAHKKAECRACHKVVEDVREFRGTSHTCAQCHADPHVGQFQQACSECHNEKKFVPARYDVGRHTSFSLAGAHGAVSCNSCHTVVNGARRFKGTPKDCASCHTDPHGEQFQPEMKKAGCVSCHAVESRSFRIRPFDHAARTRYPLEGKHAKANCVRCHVEQGTQRIRVYRKTATNCASCHNDEHRGQFGKKSCDSCHSGKKDWEVRRFDHSGTRFLLDKRHRRVSCDDCHPKVRQKDGARVVQYRPMGRECRDCHEVERR